MVSQILNTTFQSHGGDQGVLGVGLEVIIKNILWPYIDAFQAIFQDF